MQGNEAGMLGESERYHKLATDLRALVSRFKDPEVITDLRALAPCYETLAQRHAEKSDDHSPNNGA